MPPAAKKEAEAMLKGEVYQAEVSGICPKGTRGRTGIFEVLTMTPELEKIILSKPSEADIQREVLRQGMLSMKQDGLIKVLKGTIGFEELLEVV